MANIKQYSGNFYSYFVQGYFSLIIGALLPVISSEYALDYNVGGLLLAAHSLGSLSTNFASGIIADYVGRKATIIAFSACVAVGFALMTLTGNPVFLILSYFLTGVGRGSIANINNAIVNDRSKSDNSVLSILHMFFAVGAFISPFVTSLFSTFGLNWRYSAWLIVLLVGIMILIFLKMDMEGEEVSKKSADKKEKVPNLFLKNIGFYISCALLFFYLGAESSINGWLVTYLKDSGAMTTSVAQILLSVLWIVVMAGRLFCAYITRKVSHKLILLVSSAGLAVFFTMFLFSQSMWSLFLTICGIGFCFAGIYPSTIANSGNVIRGSGLGMGILLAVGGVGGIIMPYVTGKVAGIAGILGGMAAIGGCVLLMLIAAVANFSFKNTQKNNDI